MVCLTAIAVAGIDAAQRADAAPVLRAQLHQACGGCDVDLGPPFFTGGTFVSGTPQHLDQHLVLLQEGVVRQRMFTEFVPGPRVEVQGRAIAMPGAIGALAESGFIAQTFDEFASTASAVVSQSQASFRVDDAFVSMPGVAAGTRIPARLNLDVDGFIGVHAQGAGGLGGIGANTRLALDAAVAGGRHSGVFEMALNQLSTGPSFFPPRGTGFLQQLEDKVQIDNPNFPLDAQVPVSLDEELDFTVPVNVFFPIAVSAFASSITSFTLGFRGPWNHRAEALIDFITTIGFPTDRPVLELPPGSVFNSVDGRVVDNRWVGGTTPPPGQVRAVTEPASCILVGLGLMGIMLGRKWQMRSVHCGI